MKRGGGAWKEPIRSAGVRDVPDLTMRDALLLTASNTGTAGRGNTLGCGSGRTDNARMQWINHTRQEPGQAMRIAIIGSGNIGATLARLLVEAGHEIAISNARGPASLAALVAGLGPTARAATVAEAATFGELVIEAIPFGRSRELPAAALAGKILVTASNYSPQRDGSIELGGATQRELLARYLVGTRVVKAFNTIWYRHLQQQSNQALPVAQRRMIFVSGDDAEANAVVADLITQLGFGPLILGPLHASGRQEPDSSRDNNDLTVAEAQALLAA